MRHSLAQGILYAINMHLGLYRQFFFWGVEHFWSPQRPPPPRRTAPERMCASHDSTTYIIFYTLYLQSVYKFVTYACVFLSGNK